MLWPSRKRSLIAEGLKATSLGLLWSINFWQARSWAGLGAQERKDRSFFLHFVALSESLQHEIKREIRRLLYAPVCPIPKKHRSLRNCGGVSRCARRFFFIRRASSSIGPLFICTLEDFILLRIQRLFVGHRSSSSAQSALCSSPRDPARRRLLGRTPDLAPDTRMSLSLVRALGGVPVGESGKQQPSSDILRVPNRESKERGSARLSIVFALRAAGSAKRCFSRNLA